MWAPEKLWVTGRSVNNCEVEEKKGGNVCVVTSEYRRGSAILL